MAGIGERYGLRVVLSFAFKRKYPSGGTCNYWEVKCDCGNSGTASTQSLKSSSSCGCLQKEKAREIGIRNRVAFGQASFNNLYNSYKQRAKRKDIEFNLDKDVFRKLTSTNCYCCGVVPSTSPPRDKQKCFGVYIFNGLDRIDNAKGYSIENVRPCCEVCNKARRDLTEGVFREWINRLILYQSQSR